MKALLADVTFVGKPARVLLRSKLPLEVSLTTKYSKENNVHQHRILALCSIVGS